MPLDPSIERLRLALERLLETPVCAFSRAEWEDSLRDGGLPTLLPLPYGPYQSITGNPDFQFAVASGQSFAPEPGFHHVRLDEQDAPNVINVDTYIPILDLPADARWADVVRGAGLDDTTELIAAARAHVFAFRRQRGDHHAPEVPTDIASAEPRPEEEPR